jgi:hypothetical protein
MRFECKEAFPLIGVAKGGNMIGHSFHTWQRKTSGIINRFVRIQAVVLFLALAGLTSTMYGQAVGTITGEVVDPTGASVKGANVTIVESETGLSRTFTTDDSGRYTIPSLRPTLYSITVADAGFKTYVQKGITLLANQTATVDVKLTVGATSQEVTVNENASQVDVSTPTLNTVIGQTAVEELPLNGRAVAELINTVAGASGATPTVITNQTSLPGSVSPSINGSRTNSTSYLLDGANYVDEYYNTNIPFPFPDALQEFSVQTSNYSARYGESSGGVVNVVTRSGTNKFHGTLFEYNRNAIFNARNAFATAKDPLKRNQFGGTIGGPVILPFLHSAEHRTFFFGGYQGTRIRTGGQIQSYTPTAAELAGDFSAFLNASDPNNPTRRVTKITDPETGQPFPGNIIPKDRLDPASLSLAQFLPVGTGNGQSFFANTTSQNVDEYIGRIDHQLTANNRILARFYEDNINLKPQYSPTDIRHYALGYHIPVKNLMVQDTHTFSPRLLNVLSYTYSTVPVNKIASPDSPNMATFGVQNIYQPPAKFIQSINISGYFSVNGGAVGPFYASDSGVSDDVTWVKGKHTLSLGFGAERARAHNADAYLAPGAFNFTSDVTGDAMASFMLGKLRTFQQGAGEFKYNANSFFNFYANDSWHVSDRLTLTYGLRYEPYTPWNETRGSYEQFRPEDARAGIKSQVYINAPAGLFFRGDKGVPDRGVEGSMTNFAPRVGFAYDLAGNGSSSVRGGFGMFYDSHTASVVNNRFANLTPFSPQISVTTPEGPFSDPARGIANYPFPATYPPARDAVFPSPVLAVTYDPSRKYQVPVSYQYNLILEHRLPKNSLIQVAYVGMHSIHNQTSTQLNPAQYYPASDPRSKLGTDQRRVFPGFASIIMDGQIGNIHYHALQVTAKKQATRNLNVSLAYTFSKNLDDLPLGGNNNDVGNDPSATLPSYLPNYTDFDYGPSGNDHRHRFVGSYVLHLPTFSERNMLTRFLIGGWQTTGIVTLQSGGPLTVTAGVDQSRTNLGGDRAVLLAPSAVYGNDSCGTRAYCKSWLNRSAFGLPAVGSFGDRGKGQFRGPGSFNWDMGLAKDFPIKDRFTFQFRGEFFNVFNRVNYSNPNTSYSNAASFGTITGSADPRIGQLALKLKF